MIGSVEILNDGTLQLLSNGEYNRFKTSDELEIYAYKNKITLKPKGEKDEQAIDY